MRSGERGWVLKGVSALVSFALAGTSLLPLVLVAGEPPVEAASTAQLQLPVSAVWSLDPVQLSRLPSPLGAWPFGIAPGTEGAERFEPRHDRRAAQLDRSDLRPRVRQATTGVAVPATNEEGITGRTPWSQQSGERPAPTVSWVPPVEPARGWLSASDRELLARAVYAEARGESFAGQVAVAAVILNRRDDPYGRWPRSVAGIIYEPGAFSSVDDGQIDLPPNAEAYRAVDAAQNGWDPTGGAVYYWNPARTTNSWIWSRPVVTVIGQHWFAR